MCRLSERAALRRAVLCTVLSLAPALAAAGTASALALRVQLRAQPAAPGGPDPGLAQLREHAALGDTDASGELARRLLDRFERTGDRGHLHEAMQWIARDWEHEPVARATVADRVLSRHCERPALQRHWLCTGGD
jgi:hypothetical protein